MRLHLKALVIPHIALNSEILLRRPSIVTCGPSIAALKSGQIYAVHLQALELNVTRSIWHQVVGDCKTEASAKSVPMDGYKAEDLLRWRRQSPYPIATDYVFARPTIKGTQPY